MSDLVDFWKKALQSFSGPTLLPGQRPRLEGLGPSTHRVRLPVDQREQHTINQASSRGIDLESIAVAAWALVCRAAVREDHALFGDGSEEHGERRIVPAPIVIDPLLSVAEWLERLSAERKERQLHRAPEAASYSKFGGFNDAVPLWESVVFVTREEPLSDVHRGSFLTVELNVTHGFLQAEGPRDVMSEAALVRFVELWKLALLALSEAPGRRVGDISLWSQRDEEALLRYNDTQQRYPALCLHQLIEAQVRRAPAATAVSYQGQSLSYEELDRKANRLAQALRQRGVSTESLVAICVERSFDLLIGLLGILKAGGAYVPLDPEYPSERLAFMLEDTGHPLILAQKVTASAIPEGESVLFLDDPSWARDATDEDPRVSVKPENAAYVVFTSGSTGKPKGALNEHRQVVNCMLWMQEHYRLGPEDRFLQKTPYSFDASVCELFWPLIAGAQIVLARPGGHKDPEYLIETIQAERISIIDFVPSMLRVFLANPRARGCTSLRHVTCGGEALTLDLKNAFFATLNAELHNLYGPTEAAVNVTYWDVEREASSIVIGKPVANTELYILNDQKQRVPVGVPGELYIGGAQVARGYLNRPKETEERFIPNPFTNHSSERLYRTGDLVRLLPEGELEFLGRADFQVKLRGFRVELGEIEAELLEHDAVQQAAVVLRHDRKDDPRLVAYLVGERLQVTHDQLRARLLHRLPEYMVPSFFVWLDEMPLNPSGKLDRKALPKPALERPETGKPLVSPRGERETTLCGIFAEVLGFEPVGAEDNFFEVGGNSLLSMQVLSKIQGRLGVDLPVARFFEHPSPREIDRYLSNGTSSSALFSRRPRRSAGSEIEEPIAIIGMAGRFPGARNIEELWQMILEGRSHVDRFREDELDPSLPKELTSDPAYVRARGIIRDYDAFDAAFFDVSPNEAKALDPQQRLLLELAWEALEHAGYVPEAVLGLVGVFAGVYSNSYLLNHLLTHPENQGHLDDLSVLLQNEKDYVATRIAHKLNLLGPAVSVHTACSTSLVAVADAFYALRAHRCDLALAGAASVTCPPRSGYLYREGAMFSSDGYTRPYDASSEGTSFNDGAALVVLKRLADALSDGDTIYGVILGAAVNNDGSKKSSFSAPSVEGQASVIRMALDVAKVSPRTIGFVEGHGTATPIGDPIEVMALTEAFRSFTPEVGFCALGSVKSNVGHLVSAAGTTGLIKATLAVKEGVLPGTAHFEKPNPRLALETTPFFVSAEKREWHRAEVPRRAGISSFGVGGTNAHVVIEEPPEILPSGPSARPCQLLVWSAKTADALSRLTGNLGQYLELDAGAPLADVSYTLARGRRAHRERSFLVAESLQSAAAALRDPAHIKVRSFSGNAPEIAFLFPGQGAQSPNMGRALYNSDPVFRTVVDQCSELLKPELGADLRQLIFVSEESEASGEALRNTAITQPALFVIEYATSQVLAGWGIKPAFMVGHSIGEFVAAVLAGVMTLSDALWLVARRGQLMQNMPRGSMLSVRVGRERLERLLPTDLDIASDNGPELCVVAGPSDRVQAFQAELEAQGFVCRELLTSHAFHSRMMEQAVLPFRESVEKLSLSPPKIPIVSTLTGELLTSEEATSPEYWAQHLRQTVEFRAAGHRLLQQGNLALIEVGPRATLTTLLRQQVKDPRGVLSAPTLGPRPDSEWRSMLEMLGLLWSAGLSIDFESYFSDEQRRRVPLPTYPFERKRYWVDPLPRGELRVEPRVEGTATAPLAGASSSGELQMQLEAAAVFAYPTMDEWLPSSPAITSSPPMQSQTAVNEEAPSRKATIIEKLRVVFEDVSGFEMEAVDVHASFLELGLDSLSLTQVAQQIQKAFALKVTFRELMEEYPNLERLGDYMDQKLPPDPNLTPRAQAPSRPLAMPATQPAAAVMAPPQMTIQPAQVAAPYPMPTAGAPGVSSSLLQHTIDQQLALMRQQLALLSSVPMATMGQPPIVGAELSPAASGPVLSQPSYAAPVPLEPSRAAGASATMPLQSGEMDGARVEPQLAKGGASPAVSQASITNGASHSEARAGNQGNKASPVLGLIDETEVEQVKKKGFGAIARITTQKADDLSPDQRARLNAFARRYIERTQRSKAYTQQHRKRLSDPRAVTGFRPQLKELVYQIVIERSKGSHMWDLDGNEYVDVLSGFGCNLFGWQPDFASEAAIEQIQKGHEIGPMHPLAAEVAELICEMTGNERAAFCNTGSEAVMGCMRIARTVTGRDTIAIFNGSYHGIFDEVIVRGTKKLRSVPAAPGILPSTSQNVLILEYGDPEALEVLRKRGHELAAIMVEPVQSRRPDLQPRQFLHDLRKIADDAGAVYIFDEVITGFRCHPGGAQAYFGVKADLASYGKVIGGGYPFAVISGKARYMDALDGGYWQYGDDSVPTVGVTYFAGTFCRHPLALAVAKAALLHLKEKGPLLQETLNRKTAELAQALNSFFDEVGAPLEIRYFASLWKVFWKEEQPYGDLLFYYLREKGIHILDLFPCFLTTAHSDADIRAIVAAFKEAVTELQASEFLPGKAKRPEQKAPPSPSVHLPPAPGARLGRDAQGNPAWFVPDPENPAKYVQVASA